MTSPSAIRNKKRYLDNHPEKRKQYNEKSKKYKKDSEYKKRVRQITSERRNIVKNQPFRTFEEYIKYLEEV